MKAKKRSAKLCAAVFLLTFSLLTALVSVFWTPYPLDDTTGGRLEAPGPSHIFGTDRLGRDLASYIMAGIKIACMVGISATLIAVILGVSAGLLAAWLPQWADHAASSVFDVLIAFPTLLLAMLLGAAHGRSAWTAVFSIGIACSAIIARLTRILAKQVMSKWFFVSAITSGTGKIAITFLHILPNIWQVLSVNAAIIFGVSVLAEASLSYLGLGVPPPNASLGRLLQEAQSTVLTAPLGAVLPGLAIIVMVIGVNLLSDAIRDMLDSPGGTGK